MQTRLCCCSRQQILHNRNWAYQNKNYQIITFSDALSLTFDRDLEKLINSGCYHCQCVQNLITIRTSSAFGIITLIPHLNTKSNPDGNMYKERKNYKFMKKKINRYRYLNFTKRVLISNNPNSHWVKILSPQLYTPTVRGTRQLSKLGWRAAAYIVNHLCGVDHLWWRMASTWTHASIPDPSDRDPIIYHNVCTSFWPTVNSLI